MSLIASANTLSVVGTTACHSDETGTNQVVPCSSLEYIFGLSDDQSPSVDVHGNSISVNAGSYNYITQANQYPGQWVFHSEDFSANYKVTYKLSQPTPAGDIYKLTGDFAGNPPPFGNLVPTVSGSGGVSVNTPSGAVGVASIGEGTYCNIVNVCGGEYKDYPINGAGITEIESTFSVGGWVTPDFLSDSGEGGGTALVSFTLNRFKADGITPDPFVATATPEPSSWLLLCLGLLPLCTVKARRKSASQSTR
jgi:hypothetical protein